MLERDRNVAGFTFTGQKTDLNHRHEYVPDAVFQLVFFAAGVLMNVVADDGGLGYRRALTPRIQMIC